VWVNRLNGLAKPNFDYTTFLRKASSEVFIVFRQGAMPFGVNRLNGLPPTKLWLHNISAKSK